MNEGNLILEVSDEPLGPGSLCIQIVIAWWFWPYFNALTFVCWLMQMEPDEDKLTKMIVSAIKTPVVRG